MHSNSHNCSIFAKKLSRPGKMKLEEIKKILKANIVCGNPSLDTEINYAFSSDLMSDVLRIDVENLILLTGLANLQTIRTAEMADIDYILVARDKKADEEMIKLAEENGMTILESPFSLYRCSGLLFQSGLKPVY